MGEYDDWDDPEPQGWYEPDDRECKRCHGTGIWIPRGHYAGPPE